MERYALVFFYLQGGGLFIGSYNKLISGTATLTNTNVYSNEARGYVRWPSALA